MKVVLTVELMVAKKGVKMVVMRVVELVVMWDSEKAVSMAWKWAVEMAALTVAA